jgi:hypothetical protein
VVVTVKKVGKKRKKISKTGIFWRMQKLANFIIQTSQEDGGSGGRGGRGVEL